MSININDLEIRFEEIFGEHELLLKAVKPWREYEGEKQQLGYAYSINCPALCCRITVKMRGSEPVITNEELQKSQLPIRVVVTAEELVFYGKSIYEVELKVVASSVTIVPANKPAKAEGFPPNTVGK